MPRLAGVLSRADRLGTARVRLGIGRSGYRVEPGLYALGAPRPSSPVLVTANYKLTVDRVRSSLAGLDAWLLILDTDGVNVWCAAGKGTFGTDELAARVAEAELARIVDHRRLVLPQLGAPGVAGFRIRKATGFRVVWGPVDVADVPAFLAAGMQATPEMRRKHFPLRDRLALIPVELSATLRWLALLLPALLLLGGLAGGPSYGAAVLAHGLPAAAAVLAGVLAGAVVAPVMLPWLPGRAFSVKGLVPGVVAAAAVILAAGDPSTWSGRLEAVAWLLMAAAGSAFLAMGFTGSSTFTSLSGVRREMRVAVPMEIAGAAVGAVLWVAALVVHRGGA